MLQQIIEGVEGFENKVTGNISTRRSISINEIIDNNYKDFTLENINGCEFFCLYLDNEKILMEKNSLLEHLKKHNDLEISEPRDYLLLAKTILNRGRNYKNGMLYRGIFLAYYDSIELKGKLINTIYRRFY